MHGYNDQENPSFYNPFDAMSFNHDSCFLCGSPLEDNSSDEHIFVFAQNEKLPLIYFIDKVHNVPN